MNKKLLKKLQARHEQRLTQLRTLIESGEVREADLPGIQDDIDGVIEELQGIKDALGEDEGDGSSEGDDDDSAARGEGDENRSGNESGDEGNEDSEPETGGNENRAGMMTQEQRDGLLGAIRSGLNSRALTKSKENRVKEVRRKFAEYVIGKVSDSEARALGIVSGNGGVVVPKEIVPEVISYAQEINPLRTDGTMHRTNSQLGFPVLVKKATAQGHKEERGVNQPIPDTTIEFDEIVLDPTEFDALALITKKLMNRSDIPIEDIVMEELGKAYAEKEGIYFFRGDEVGNVNPGALQKKAVQVYATKEVVDGETTSVVAIDGKNGPELHDALVDMKNAVKASVRRVSKWYLNDAAIGLVEKMKDNEGRPLYSPTDQLQKGIDGKLLNYPVSVTEFADKAMDDPDTPIFYFGDPKSFHMQEVIGSLEVQKLVEKYADTNHIGLKIYNLLDGQLLYSPLEPTMYMMEIGAVPNP